MEELMNNSSKKMPYTVPEGFFEDMHRHLLDEVRANADHPLHVDMTPHANARKKFWMSAAAVVLLIAGVSFYALQRMEETETPLLASQSESVESYMTDEALDEWIAIYEGVDNSMVEDIVLDTDNTIL